MVGLSREHKHNTNPETRDMNEAQRTAAIKQLAILTQTGSTLKEAVDMIVALFPAASAKQDAQDCLRQYIADLDATIEILN